MSTLTIRNLPDNVHAALRLQAARDGISVEAEVRKILADACKPELTSPVAGLQDLVDQLYAGNKPKHVVENLLQERQTEAKSE